jgi:cytochrome o ubiquinol oxidase subunit 1
VVSIRNRHANRDLTGDPWNGRTLEWTTASPPAVYNFAVIPAVQDIDALADMKEKGISWRQTGPFHDIDIPKDTALGPIMGALAFLFGFAMVWSIWWLASISMLAMVLAIVIRSIDDDTDYTIPAAEVKRIEDERYAQATAANKNRKATGQMAPQPAPEA